MAQILKYGSTGSPVDLLQLALNRAGAALALDGVFGSATRAAVQAFQRAHSLQADGVVGSRTTRALLPYYTGYQAHTIRPGDTLYRLAMTYNNRPRDRDRESGRRSAESAPRTRTDRAAGLFRGSNRHSLFIGADFL